MNFILRDVRRLALMGLLLLGLCVANGAQAQTITLSDRYVSTTYGHYGSTALYVLSYNGDIITSAPSGMSQIDVGDWLTPKSNMSSFQARATSSTCNNGQPVNTWLALSTSSYWYITANAGSPVNLTCTVYIQISAVANPTVILGSAIISLNAYH